MSEQRKLRKLQDEFEAERKGISVRALKRQRHQRYLDRRKAEGPGILIKSIEGVRFGGTTAPRPRDIDNSLSKIVTKDMGELATLGVVDCINEQITPKPDDTQI